MIQNSKLAQNLLFSVNGGLPGANLVTNGTFDTSTTGWTLGNATLSSESGGNLGNCLKVLGINGSVPYAYQAITTVNGATYTIALNYKSADSRLRVGTSEADGTYIDKNISATSWTAAAYTFKATGTTTYITVGGYYGGVASFYFDNIVIRELNASALALPNPAYNLTNTAAMPTYGHKGNGSYWAFNGVDDYIPISVPAFGTGDFSVVIRFKLNVWKTYNFLLDTNGSFSMYVAVDGKLNIFRRGGSSIFSGGNVPINTDNTIVYTRLSGAYSLTINGTNYTGSDANDYDVAILNLGRAYDVDHFLNGSVSSLLAFNYALDAAGVTYYSNPANHLKAVDQITTAEATTNVLVNPNFSSGDTDWIKAAGWTIVDQGGGDYEGVATNVGDEASIYQGSVVTGGLPYITKFTITNYTSGSVEMNLGGIHGTARSSTGTFSEVITPSITYAGITGITTATLRVDNISVIRAGCVLSLTPEGMISPTLWRDYYHNIDISLSGATAPRLYKEQLGAWKFGTGTWLKKTSGDGLTGDITIAGWFFATAWGGFIFSNDNILISANSVATALRCSNNGNGTSLYSSAITLNSWNHFVYVKPSSGNSSIYINGVKVTGDAGATTSGTTYYVGNYSNEISPFIGIIEGFRIYKTAWSAEMVALDYSVFQ